MITAWVVGSLVLCAGVALVARLERVVYLHDFDPGGDIYAGQHQTLTTGRRAPAPRGVRRGR